MIFLTIQNTRFYLLVIIDVFWMVIKSFLFLDDFTEDVYFMHEELVQELEAQYEVNKTIYEQIEIWNELFVEFQEFEVRFDRVGIDVDQEFSFRKALAILNVFIVEVIALLQKKKLEEN
jgi:hypothetical protein